VLTPRHSYDLFSASVDKRFPHCRQAGRERKFNGERSWCYSTGPAGMWTCLECGSGVRYAGPSYDGHRRDRRFQHRKRCAYQQRRRRQYRRASRHQQRDSCAVHGHRMRTGASAELQPPGAKVDSSLTRAPRRAAGNSCDISRWCLVTPYRTAGVYQPSARQAPFAVLPQRGQVVWLDGI
jgi:hypothetical protein